MDKGRFSIVLLSCLMLLATRQTHAARVGIISSADLNNAADLLTESLSKQNDIQLVERAELARIAGEAALSNASQTGKLLGADALLFLDSSGSQTNRAATIRVVAANAGVILYSSRLRWPPENIQAWANNITPKIARAAIKAAVPPEKAIKLSVLNLRSAINSPSQQLLERELTSLLLTRLAQEPELFVLERRQLGAAVFEKELAASEEKFWTGSHLLDGVINRDKFDPARATISARLRDPAGADTTIDVEGPRDQLGKVVEDLVGKLLAALKVEKRANWDPAREAAQHLEEANWALRWSMWREAQSAADSAWALGERSLDAASTRMLAYSRATKGYALSWVDVPEQRLRWPAKPPPAQLADDAFQSVALLNETLSHDNDVVINANWWKAARETLDQAGETLTLFFWRAEAREGVSDKLADLRALCRSAMETLIKLPAIRKDYWLGPDEIRSPDAFEDYFRNGADIFSIYAHRAPVFDEKPEDTVAVFRLLMSGDPFPYVRHQLFDEDIRSARLGGWRWADRKREVQLWESFVKELNGSTNVLLQLEGLLFQVTLIPETQEYLEGGDSYTKKTRSEVLAFIGKNKAALLAAKSSRKIGNLGVSGGGRADQAFMGRVFWDFDQEYFEAYQKRGERHKIVDAENLLRSKQPYKFRDFAPLVHLDYSTNEATEMLALLKEYREEVTAKEPDFQRRSAEGFLSLIERRLKEKAGLAWAPSVNRTNISSGAAANNAGRTTNVANLPRPGPNFPRFSETGGPIPRMGPGGPFNRLRQTNEPTVETITAPATLKVDQFWDPPIANKKNIYPEVGFRPLLRDGKFWCRYFYQSDFEDGGLEWRSAIFRIDPDSWRVEERIDTAKSEFVARIPYVHKTRSFEVLNDDLFIVGAEALMMRPKSAREWRKLPLAAPNGQLWRVGTNLYLLSPDSLHEINPVDGSARALVSTRRRPAVTPLDELDSLAQAGLTEGPSGSLRAVVGKSSFLFDGANWQRESTLTNATWIVSDNAAFALTSDLWRPTELRALFASQTKPEFIAKATSAYPGMVMPVQVTNWVFSALSLRSGKPFALGTNVALFCARGEATTARVRVTAQTSMFDLFIFGPAGPKPIQVPLDFDLNKGRALVGTMMALEFTPWMLVTDRELLIGSYTVPGVWRIPRASIDDAIKAALAQPSNAQKTAEAKE